MSTIDTRREQMFPKLEPREIDRLRRFGEVRRYAAGRGAVRDGRNRSRHVRADQGLSASHPTRSLGAQRSDRGAGTR